MGVAVNVWRLELDVVNESLQNQGSEDWEWIEAASPLRWGGPGNKQSWVYTAKAHFKL